MSTQEERVARIVAKALEDPAFKATLLADASATIEKELKLQLPRGLKVKIVEDTPSTVHFVLTADYRISRGPQPSKAGGDKRLRLIERAWDDAALKKRLLKDPKTVLAEETGAPYPPSVAVRVLEDTDKVVHIVLPLSDRA